MNPIELDTSLLSLLPPWYREVLDSSSTKDLYRLMTKVHFRDKLNLILL